MEITISNTGFHNQHHAVSVTTRSDDLDISEIGALIRALLLAWEYAPESVDALLNKDI